MNPDNRIWPALSPFRYLQERQHQSTLPMYWYFQKFPQHPKQWYQSPRPQGTSGCRFPHMPLPSFVTAWWLGGSLFLSLCPGTDSGDTQYNCFGPNVQKVLGPALSANPQSFFSPSSIRVYAHLCPLQLALNSTWHHSSWWISSSTHGQATGFVQYSHNYTGLFFFFPLLMPLPQEYCQPIRFSVNQKM